MIQKNKLSVMQDRVIKSFWSNEEMGFYFYESRGPSGGLLILWKEWVVEVLCSFRGESFLDVKVKWRNFIYYIANVYSSCEWS